MLDYWNLRGLLVFEHSFEKKVDYQLYVYVRPEKQLTTDAQCDIQHITTTFSNRKVLWMHAKSQLPITQRIAPADHFSNCKEFMNPLFVHKVCVGCSYRGLCHSTLRRLASNFGQEGRKVLTIVRFCEHPGDLGSQSFPFKRSFANHFK